jgi:hypothetical protein
MDVDRILSELHSELEQIEQAILCLERSGIGITEAAAQSEPAIGGSGGRITGVN